MTIRNAVPRFGMRTVVVLAVLAMAALAALLAVGSPASAQSSLNETEILSSTMTVGSHPNLDINGYYDVGSNTYGAMSFTDVPSVVNEATDHYAIQHLIDSASGNQLHFGLLKQLEDKDREAYTLHIGERSFDFADATYSFSTGTSIHAYSWPLSPRFGWATGQSVAVKITSLPILSVNRAIAQVQYSGNNNAAESTAEFIFTRTGSADEALSFTIAHWESGESWPRTFEAGQSSFSNYHWAADEDADGNPVCEITWSVQPGDGYVVHSSDFVDVISVRGPGTTCMSGM